MHSRPRRLLSEVFGKSIWTLTCVAGLFGTGVLFLSGELRQLTREQLTHEFLRDIGIAFLVSAVIAVIYELHARARYDRETMRGVLGSIYNDIVDGSVWNEIRNQILDREVVRKNGQVTLSLIEDDSLPKGQYVVWIEFEYHLCGLRSTPRKVNLRHFLDSFMKSEDLPRFDQIVIGDQVYRGSELDKYYDAKTGVFEKRHLVDGRSGEPIPVVVERREIVYVPGAYNLIMGELTDGVRIHLQGICDGIQLDVNVKEDIRRLKKDDYQKFPEFFLPYQAIEFRFRNVEPQPVKDKTIQVSEEAI